MMELVSFSAGLFTNLFYDLLKNGGAMTVPHLREKLKDWVFKDETANHIVELSSSVPADKLVDAKAFEDYIQASGLWQSQLKEITQSSTEYHGSNHVEGSARDLYSTKEGNIEIHHHHESNKAHEGDSSAKKS